MNNNINKNKVETIIIAILIILTVSAFMAKIEFWGFLFQIVLTITSIILAIAYTALGVPKLKFEILNPEKIYVGSEETLFLKLNVFNSPLKNIPLVSRNTAYSCHGTISILKLSREPIYTMPIRWSNNPQPFRFEIDRGEMKPILDQSLLRVGRYIDIPADENEPLDVCFRIPTETVAYGWNNDSYVLSGGKFPDRALPSGTYLIHINISHSDGSVQAEFFLNNSETIDEFNLRLYTNQQQSLG